MQKNVPVFRKAGYPGQKVFSQPGCNPTLAHLTKRSLEWDEKFGQRTKLSVSSMHVQIHKSHMFLTSLGIEKRVYFPDNKYEPFWHQLSCGSSENEMKQKEERENCLSCYNL